MAVIVQQLTLARPELSKSTAFCAGQGQFGRRNIRRLGLEDRILAKVVNRARDEVRVHFLDIQAIRNGICSTVDEIGSNSWEFGPRDWSS